MILRATVIGILLWALEAAALRFVGAQFFTPAWAPSILAFAASAAIGVLVTLLALKVLREAHGDEGEAALGLALPGLLLGALAVNFFPIWFANLDPTLDGVLGAHFLLQAAAIAFTGLFFTRLAQQDERL